ncbi:predicted protein [Naegleria gruberi]|uniref:Predicted protein n=1 Tax=Naegleria gruberi TaxID=5762 RepID=D2V3A7_NAEGR|nr:uncharacterized protein NAEGRDRAFT_63288 [Naegleria gruberi]EFC48605.1 predicted protein [Naegleria gruberi]|eukprot:XP_002681349.1 predicted protein [Naegleria gruberi strain NEG-M]
MDSNYHNVCHRGCMIDIIDREWMMDVLPNDDITIILPNDNSSKNPIQNTLSQLTNNHPSLATHPLFVEDGVAIADMKDNSILGDNHLQGIDRPPSEFVHHVNEWNDLNLFSLLERQDETD